MAATSIFTLANQILINVCLANVASVSVAKIFTDEKGLCSLLVHLPEHQLVFETQRKAEEHCRRWRHARRVVRRASGVLLLLKNKLRGERLLVAAGHVLIRAGVARPRCVDDVGPCRAPSGVPLAL